MQEVDIDGEEVKGLLHLAILQFLLLIKLGVGSTNDQHRFVMITTDGKDVVQALSDQGVEEGREAGMVPCTATAQAHTHNPSWSKVGRRYLD